MEKLYIGNKYWIEWKIINPKGARVKDIDVILKPTKNLWKNLEYNCIAECCGIMAFSFEEKAIWSACLDLNVSTLIRNFEIIQQKLFEIEEQVISSSIINQYMDKRAFENLIKYLIKILKKLSKSEFNYT